MAWPEDPLPAIRHEAHFRNRLLRCFAERPASLFAMFEQTLAAHAERWALDARFHLLTGAPDVVHAVREAYGVRAFPLPDGEIAHDSVIVILDGRGRIAFTLRGGAGTAGELAALLTRLAREG